MSREQELFQRKRLTAIGCGFPEFIMRSSVLFYFSCVKNIPSAWLPDLE